jgi:hypothetical protein
MSKTNALREEINGLGALKRTAIGLIKIAHEAWGAEGTQHLVAIEAAIDDAITHVRSELQAELDRRIEARR